MAAIFIDTTRVAALLGQTADQFLRVRADLEDQHGFPLPMPHWKRPMKWRADQVEGWIEACGRPRDAMTPRPSGPNIILLEEARRA